MDTLRLVRSQNGFELPLETDSNWVMKRELGYSPVQSVVAATAACGGYVYESILKNSNVDYMMHHIIVTFERENSKVAPLSKIDITFEISVSPNDENKAVTALKLINKYCPVMQSLSSNVVISEHVSFI